MSTQFTNRQWRLPNNENKDKQSNYSMDFDSASSDYIEVSNMPILTDFSLSFWYKQNGPAGSYETVVGKDTIDGGILTSIAFTGGVLSFKNRPGSWTALTTTSASNTEFKHYSITYDSSANELKGYCNGILEVTTTPVFSGNEHSFNRIGRYFFGSYLDGELDALAIFNYALTDGTGGTVNQIAALYGSSSTGIGNPMSLSPKPVAYYPLGDQDAFNGANYLVPNSSLKDYVFDFASSNNNYISFANGSTMARQQNITYSAWVKFDSVSANQMILGNRVNSTSGAAIFVQSNVLRFQMGDGATSSDSYYNNAVANLSNYISSGEWGHIAATWDGTDAKVYVNGVERSSWTPSQPYTITGWGEFFIGRRSENTTFLMNGELSNLAFWNSGLTSPQIETIYNNGSPSDISSLNPVSWWKLDASDTYNSSTGNWTIEDHAGSNDGTSSGMTQANLVQSDLSFTSGYSPYALDFDSSSSDHIQIPYNVNLTPQNGNFTISAWINTDNLSGWHSIWCTQNLFSSNIPLVSLHTFGDKVRAVVGGSTNNPSYPGSWALLLDSTESLTTSTWYHIAVSYDMSGDAQIYINGNADNSGPIENPQTSWTTSDRFIGDGEDFWDGRISNLSIWNTDLTSAQVTELYNEGVPSNLNNHSAYSNLISWWQLGNNTSWVDPYWIALDEKGTNNGQSQNVAAPNNMGENAIVDGVGSYANGLSSGMGGDEVIGDAPYSTSNALSVNMDVEDRVTDTPS